MDGLRGTSGRVHAPDSILLLFALLLTTKITEVVTMERSNSLARGFYNFTYLCISLAVR